MPWFRVDDGLASKIETTRIPRAHRAAAIGLWALAGSWSARELTDGHIPAHMIDELAGTSEAAQRLVEAGFWLAVEDGYQFAVWDGQQPMREKVLETRAKTAARVNSWRAKNTVGNAVTNDAATPSETLPPNPARPEPNPSTSSEVETPSSPSATTIATEFDQAWTSWPKKTEKKKSLEAFRWAAALRGVSELTADVIRFGHAYGASTERQFVPALCVWLRGERWTDDLPTSRPPTAEQWDAFLAEQPPRATPAERCETSGHRFLPNGTCLHCPAQQGRLDVGAA